MLAVAIGDPEDRRESLSHPLVMGLTTTDDLPTNGWLQSESHAPPRSRPEDGPATVQPMKRL